MVGRAVEMSALMDALAEVETGPTVVVVQAEAGAGKTRLVSEFLERARTSGAVTLVGGCFPLGGVSPPYAPLAQAIRSYLGTLPAEAAHALSALLPPELLSGFRAAGAAVAMGTAEQRAALFDKIGVAFATMSGSAAVVLVLEDVHWADQSTRDAVSYLFYSLSNERVLLVVTHRVDELDRQPDLRTWLVQLRRSPHSAVVVLAPLGHADITDQIAGITGTSPSPELVDAVAARADGNPLHVEELVAAGPPPVGQPPSTLLDAITSRLELLPDDSRRLVRAAAAVGRHVGDELLCAAAGLSAAEIPDKIRPAISRHVLRPVPGELAYEFHHELVREAAYGELLPGERVAVHAAIARCLAARSNRGSDATHLALVAHHWSQTDQHASAIPALIAAGTAALGSAGFAEAYDQLSRAIRLWLRMGWKPADELEPGRDLIGVAQLAARAALLCGATADARELGELVLDQVDPEEDPERYCALVAAQGFFRMLDGDSSAARSAYERALALLPTNPPTNARATVLYRFAWLCSYLGEVELAHRSAAEAVDISRALADSALEGRASALLGLTVAFRGDPQRGTTIVNDALEMSTANNDVEAIINAHVRLTDIAMVAGRVPDLLASAQNSLALATRLGAGSSRAASYLSQVVGRALVAGGDWSGGERILEECLARPDDRLAAVMPAIHLARLRVAQGRFDLAADLLPPEEVLRPCGRRPLALANLVGAELAIWQGRLDYAGSAIARAAKALGGELQPQFTGWVIGTAERIMADSMQLARDLGEPATTPEAADSLLRSWLGRQTRRPDPSTPRMLAWLRIADAEYSRRSVSDTTAWTAAVAACQDYGDTSLTAYARFRLAEALVARPADRSRTTEPLRLAWDFSRTVGALPLLGEIEALARRARITLEPVVVTPSASGPAAADQHGLTNREIEVVRLLADGATNAQIAKTLFISEKTAAIHVSNILRKLGAARRTEAAAIAHRLGITNQPPPQRRS